MSGKETNIETTTQVEEKQVNKLPEDPKLKKQAIIVTIVCAVLYLLLIYFVGY